MKGLRSRRFAPDGAEMANGHQVRRLHEVWLIATGGRGTQAELRDWLEEALLVSDVRFLTCELAVEAIGFLLRWQECGADPRVDGAGEI